MPDYFATCKKPIFDLETLLRDAAVETWFQPIVSLRKQRLIGIEALSRGVLKNSDGTTQNIAPLELFAAAQSANHQLELDRLCFRSALRHFQTIQDTQHDLVLFLNLHAATLHEESLENGGLQNVLQTFGIEPRRIVLEVLEQEIKDSASFKSDIEALRSCGFLIALDDVGAGHSNLDRIAFARPDILKIDRVLLQDIHCDYHKQEVFKSLVNLSEKIGGWTVSEGLECEEDALMALDLGADMMQGFFFARPQIAQQQLAGSEIEYSKANLKQAARHFKTRVVERIGAKRVQHEERVRIVDELRALLQKATVEEFELKLRNAVTSCEQVESVCVLDENGTQISQTITQMTHVEKPKSLIFAPPTKGTDHSFKEYFYCLTEADLDPFFSNPYVPLPSGELCVTASTRFRHDSQSPFVLCVHFNAMNSLKLEPEPFALQANKV